MSEPTGPVAGADNLAAAAEQLRAAAAPAVAPPPEDEVALGLAARQAAAPAGVTSVDVEALAATILHLQERLSALEEERQAGAAVPVQATAETLRDLIKVNAAHHPAADHADLVRLADDAVEAAKDAVQSGDGSLLAQIAGKIERALDRVHPGPGDHHYHAQATAFARVHLPDAAAQLVPRPQQPAAGVLGSSGAARPAIQGSVIGGQPAGSGGQFSGHGVFVRET